MEDRIARELAAGRAQLRAGKSSVAIATWKEALRVAYDTRNHAAAFVLSKNLGDAALESTYATSKQEAVEFYEYALQLLDGCQLQDQYACHPPLENVVQYIRRRRRRARRLLCSSTVPLVESKFVEPVEPENALNDGQVCTTCEQAATSGNPMIVDDADGCLYCQSCFDSYYADVEDPVAVGGSEGVENSFEPVPGSRADHASALSDRTGSLRTTQPQTKDAPSPSFTVKQGESEVVGVTNVEAAATLYHDQESLIPTATKKIYSIASLKSFGNTKALADCELGAALVELPGGDSSSIHFHDQHYGKRPVTVGESQELNESSRSEATSPAKFIYTVDELKCFRGFDRPCPREIEASPVSLTNGVAKQTTNGKQQTTSPPSGSHHGSKRSTAKASTATHQPSSPQNTATSLVPSVAECDAARAAVIAQPSPLELANVLFNAVPQNPGARGSFTTQLQLFSGAE